MPLHATARRRLGIGRTTLKAKAPLDQPRSAWLSHPTDGDMWFLERIYEFRDSFAVRRHLARHPYLVPSLLQAREHIERHFGPRHRVVLEVRTDPDAADRDELALLIPTREPVPEAIRKLAGVEEEWWLDMPPDVLCAMTLDVEFV